jgi:hypothetical protein
MVGGQRGAGVGGGQGGGLRRQQRGHGGRPRDPLLAPAGWLNVQLGLHWFACVGCAADPFEG